MSIMTAEQYHERKASLVSAIAHAEGEFQSTSFRELTANGTADATAKAKRHLDLTRAELDKVEAAWIASQVEIDRLSVKGIADDFDKRTAEIEALLADRQKALRAVIEATDAAAQAIAWYDDATRQIRTKGAALAQSRYATAGNTILQITSAVDMNVAASACCAILNTAHIRLTGNALLCDAFPNGDAAAFEVQLANRVRAAVQAAAPKAEAA